MCYRHCNLQCVDTVIKSAYKPVISGKCPRSPAGTTAPGFLFGHRAGHGRQYRGPSAVPGAAPAHAWEGAPVCRLGVKIATFGHESLLISLLFPCSSLFRSLPFRRMSLFILTFLQILAVPPPPLQGFTGGWGVGRWWGAPTPIMGYQAYFAAVAAFSINAATSCACERKIAWLPGSSMTCDWARFAMNRSRSGLIIRSCLGITA